MKTHKLAPKVIAFVLTVGLALPSSAWALRTQAGMESSTLLGLQKELTAGLEAQQDKIKLAPHLQATLPPDFDTWLVRL